MKKAIASIIAALILIGFYALLAWGASILIEYVFEIEFGFWKTAAAWALLAIVGATLRGSSKGGNRD